MSLEQFWHERFAAAHTAERAREEQWQDEAFAACTHTVCGLELRGMTAYDLLVLHGCSNSFICGGKVAPGAVRQFLALLVDPAPQGWFARRSFFRAIEGYNYADTVREIRAFVDRMFAASGIKQAAPGAGGDSAEPINLCFLAPLVVRIASDTGWSEADILGMRLDKLFQYRRALDLRAGSRNPLAASDRLISDALAAYNEYLAAHKAAAS